MTTSVSTIDPRPTAHPLQQRKLSRLSFGGAPIGNLYTAVDDETALATILRAWQQGIRHFDTAPYYGYGLSESRLGDALQGLERSSFSLSTKVGRRIEADASRSDHADGFVVDGYGARFDYSRDGILRSLEASLKRLRTDHVEILLLHDIGTLTHGENHPAVLRQALEEALPTMAELRDQGVCDAIGIGVNEEAICMQLMPLFPLDVIMLAGRYTLFEQAASEAVMRQALARGVRILAAGPYNAGLLGGSGGPGGFYNYQAASSATLERARRYYEVCAATGTDVGATALQFPLAHPAVSSVVCGLRSVAEVDCAAERLRHAIPDDTWSTLREAGLLLAWAPTP
jgi:D-threo-aldose 1-dehydrogenase